MYLIWLPLKNYRKLGEVGSKVEDFQVTSFETSMCTHSMFCFIAFVFLSYVSRKQVCSVCLSPCPQIERFALKSDFLNLHLCLYCHYCEYLSVRVVDWVEFKFQCIFWFCPLSRGLLQLHITAKSLFLFGDTYHVCIFLL